MEKRASPGVLKKRPTKRSKRRGLLSYLRNNSYMFAPLISRSSSHLFPQKTLLFSDPGGRAREENERSLVENIGEYLKSDSYMYAPIVDIEESKHAAPEYPCGSVGDRYILNCWSSLSEKTTMLSGLTRHGHEKAVKQKKGPICQLERAFVASSARKTTTDDQLTNQSASLIVENHLSNDDRPEISLTGHSFGQRETVKHMVYQNCRKSTVSEKQRLNKEFRKVVID